MTREWILRVLESLPVWCWPVFLWDVIRVRAWWHSLPLETETMLRLGVDRRGRIHVIDLIAKQDALPETGASRLLARALRGDESELAEPAEKLRWRTLTPLFPLITEIRTTPDFADSG